MGWGIDFMPLAIVVLTVIGVPMANADG